MMVTDDHRVKRNTVKADELSNMIDPIVQSFGCELWGVEYRTAKASAHLRVFIDKQEGVSIDDCSKVSRQLSAVFDVEDPIKVPYQLEVSSTGIDKPMMSMAHYQRYQGHVVKIKLQRPIDGRRKLQGQILSAEADTVVIEEQGTEYALPYDAIGRGRLVIEF